MRARRMPSAAWVDGYTTVAFTTRPRDKQLAFSPNGAKVVLVNDTGGAKLIIANANGSGRRVLTTGYNPDWQPLP